MVNYNTENDFDLSDIDDEIKTIVGMRGLNRQLRINRLAFSIHHTLKRLGYSTITKQFFNSFFLGIEKPTTRKDLKKDFLKYLFDKKKFSVDIKKKKAIRYLRVVEGGLMSKDDESYKVMMSKNGFKSYAYKYVFDVDKKIPKRKLLGVSNINTMPDDIVSECDFIDNKSHKPRHKGKYKQGVYGVVEKSIRHEQNTHDAQVYKIL